MGLGKTIELLACKFSHWIPSSAVSGGSYKAEQLNKSERNQLKRLKRERVECVCGVVNESYRYKGLWVQCDFCDACQHADCVGYSARRKSSKVTEEEQSDDFLVENSRKMKKRKKDAEIVETDGEYMCQTCLALIHATESLVPTSATLIVCPTPILLQWHTEILWSYKNGYVWNDLSENDAIYPSEGAEYVLKGSEHIDGYTDKLYSFQVGNGNNQQICGQESNLQPKIKDLGLRHQSGVEKMVGGNHYGENQEIRPEEAEEFEEKTSYGAQ